MQDHNMSGGAACMYQIGDHVVYGVHGVWRIKETEDRMVDRKCVSYYVLEPLEQPGARYLVPMHNQAALGKLRPVLSREELNDLLRSDAVHGQEWIPDENRRKQNYRELIVSGDRAALIRMVGALHRHKAEQAAAGRKFHLCDENFLRDAQKILDTEFSLVLGIEPGQVGNYILTVMGNE